MRELLHRRDFRLLLTGQTLSMAGDWTLLLVFGIWGKTLTGSNAVAGLMIFAMAAPGLLTPLGAVVVDRISRRALMIGLDLTSALVVLSLWFVRDRGQLWLLFAVAVWYGLSSVVVNAAVSALVQDMLPTELVGRANGALTTVRQGLRLAAPLIGAGLFATVGGGAVATLDAVTFVGSAVAVAFLPFREHPRARTAVSFREEVVAGARHVLAVPVLRGVCVIGIVVALAFGVVETGVFALVSDGLHRPATFLSVLVSMQGIGAIVGGLAVTAAITRFGEVASMVAGLALLTGGVVLEPVTALPVTLIGFAVFGAGLTVFNVATATLLQRDTPNALMGRVAVAADLSSSVPYTASVALGALLVGLLPFQAIFALTAAGCALATAFALRGARVWRASGSLARPVTAG